MINIDRIEWLDIIHTHYDRQPVTPLYVAAELLLGRTDPTEVARSINRRGRKVGDPVMVSTTPACVSGALEELISLGFLESVFSAASPVSDDAEEHVLELRLPD